MGLFIFRFGQTEDEAEQAEAQEFARANGANGKRIELRNEEEIETAQEDKHVGAIVGTTKGFFAFLKR